MQDQTRQNVSSPIGDKSDVIQHALLTSIESDVVVASRLAGIHGVLGYLNARTRYRFSGICPLDPAWPFPAYSYDRENPGVASGDFDGLRRMCQCIAHAEGLLTRAPSSRDVAASASCIGAPLLGSRGGCWGILCHFDLRLRTPPRSEAAILRFLGANAPRWLDLPSRFAT